MKLSSVDTFPVVGALLPEVLPPLPRGPTSLTPPDAIIPIILLSAKREPDSPASSPVFPPVLPVVPVATPSLALALAPLLSATGLRAAASDNVLKPAADFPAFKSDSADLSLLTRFTPDSPVAAEPRSCILEPVAPAPVAPDVPAAPFCPLAVALALLLASSASPLPVAKPLAANAPTPTTPAAAARPPAPPPPLNTERAMPPAVDTA